MNRRKVFLVARREYVESVRKKSFLFGLVATPAVMIAMILFPLLAGDWLVDDRLRIAVVDETDDLGPEVRRELERTRTEAEKLTIEVDLVAGAIPAELDHSVASGRYSAWIRLPPDFAETGRFDVHTESMPILGALDLLEARLARVLVERRAAALGLPPGSVDRLLAHPEPRTFRVGSSDSGETDFLAVYFQAVALVMFLFFALVPTGQILMRSVIEEKSNRVIEVLVSSMTPGELMVGKILGLGAVGLTMLGAWAACGAILTLRPGATFPIGADRLATFVLYFVPGYFLYAALLGAIGSICSTERDAQPFQLPINLMLIFPVTIGVVIAQNPENLLARALSFVPFFTPSLMLFRTTIQEPPAWEIAATWAVLAAGTVAMFVIAGRVFRVGVLMTGKRPGLTEILRWVRAG